jgi:uncharacterized membrane protein YphA (DoxX/SURF4 family)
MNTTTRRHPAVHPAHYSRGAEVGLWIVQFLLALVFFIAGAKKIIGNPDMVRVFAAIGWGQWFRYFTGVIELLGSVMLVLPRLRAFGASLLSCVMLGAILTHVVVLHVSPALPAVLLIALLCVLYARRTEIDTLVHR